MTEIDPVTLCQALVRAESVTPAGPAAFDVAEAALSSAGFTVERMTFGGADGSVPVENLFATKGSGGRHLAFAGHVDVVPPGPADKWDIAPFSGLVEGDTLYGRGAQDMKGGVAAMIAAAARWDGAPGTGRISFLITGDEEGRALNGTKPLVAAIAARDPIDAAILGEPTSRAVLGDTIKIGRRGSVSAEVKVTGVQGHVAYQEKAQNPMPALLAIGQALLEPLDEGSQTFAPSNLEIVSIDVGNPVFNVIPAEATLRFNVRVNDRWTVASLKETLDARIEKAAGDIAFSVHWVDGASGAFHNPDEALIARVSDAIHRATGIRPEATTGGGSSDARFIKDHCPVLEFGAVGSMMHQTNEKTSVSELRRLADTYREIIDAVLAP